MTMLSDRIAVSRFLLGLVTGAVVACCFQFIAPDACANSPSPGVGTAFGNQARPGDQQARASKGLFAHNQRSDERPPVAAVPSPAEVHAENSLSGGLGIGASIGGAAPLVPQGSVKVIRMATPASLPTFLPEALTVALYKELSHSFAGFTSHDGSIDIGTVVDGEPRLLFVSIGGETRQTFWWFAPPDQPEGWFDDSGKRLGNSVLGEPKPNSRISSTFGIRRYYGRISSGGFHNGIDYEGKLGEPIFAAADGVVNHSGWYFEYGRTVKITHADKFETLYAHLSHFADGIGPGSKVHGGQLIGYVGMTGRSTGPHLHFSTIVHGQFVDPQPYISGHRDLRPDSLVLFRKWQQAIRAAADAQPDHQRFQPGDDWTTRI